MKKTFLARRNTLLSSSGVPWGMLGLFCVFVVLLVRLVAPNFFWTVFSPFYRAADALSTGTHSLFAGFGNVAELSKDNERLTEENAALVNENKMLLQRETTLLALNNLSSGQKKVSPGIFASVVARPPESPYDTLVLAAGSDAGVTLGQEAFGAGGVPLGVVSSVLADFSRVTLFSAPGMTTNGWVGDALTTLTLEGVGGGAFNATAPRTANIEIDDTVFLPGPGALPVGKVVRIDSDPSSPLETVRIMPTLNIFSVTNVILRDTGAALTSIPLCATSTQ